MDAPETSPTAIATVDVELKIGNRLLATKVSVPAGPTRMADLLPIVQRVANTIVDSAVDEAVEQGRTISCTKGCGACCRQLVPISEIEARGLRDMIRDFPEPRRSRVVARFAEAQQRLADAGLLDKLRERAEWDEDAFMEMGTRYFHQGIPCPFLEDESCSIHLERPVVCREYLVTSPAANCACPTKDNIEKVGLPVQVWTALARCTQADPGAKYCRWVPLVLAPEWADSHPDESPARPGPEVLREFFERLAAQGAQKDLSEAGSPPSS